MKTNKNERGQTLVLFALMLTGLFAIMALVIDGGYIYAQRRAAQNAADAGAIAGAQLFCAGADPTSAAFLNTIDQYIQTNHATRLGAVGINNSTITVDTEIVFPPFLAQVVGRNEVQVQASATAGCFVPTVGKYVLPVAWSCRPPQAAFSDPDWVQNANPNIPCDLTYVPDGGTHTVSDLYLLMDTKNLNDDFICKDENGLPADGLDCDLDNDGVDDVVAGGNRGWLDLDGGSSSANELVNWVSNGFSDEVRIHTWYGGKSGVAATVFQAVEARVGDTVLVPIFDRFCHGHPETYCNGPEPTVDDRFEDDIDTVVAGSGVSTDHFRVMGFAKFVITCVQATPLNKHDPRCPAFALMEAQNPSENFQNVKSIEGYFTTGYMEGISSNPSTPGAYTGVVQVYLTK